MSQSAPVSPPGLFGIDHSSHPPTPADLKNANVRFVCRYLSTPGNPKNITLVEATDLKLAGIDVVLVFETGGNRALDGHAAGAADALSARAQAGLVGLAGAPIYFAVDFDAQPAQLPQVLAYLHGAASMLGRNYTGVYGGRAAVKAALDAGACRYAWQTYAWSGGVWDPRAHLHQYANGQSLCGISVDFDRANAPDFGQHKELPPQPKPAGDSPAHTGRENVPGPDQAGRQPKPAGTSPAHKGRENVPGPTQTGEQPRRWRYSQGDLSSAVGQLRRPPPGAAMGRPRSHLGQRSPTGGDPHSPAQLTPSADSGRFSRCRLTVGLRQPLRVTRSRPAAPTTETHSTNGETHRRPSCERPGPVSPGSFASTGMRGHSRRTPRR